MKNFLVAATSFEGRGQVATIWFCHECQTALPMVVMFRIIFSTDLQSFFQTISAIHCVRKNLIIFLLFIYKFCQWAFNFMPFLVSFLRSVTKFCRACYVPCDVLLWQLWLIKSHIMSLSVFELWIFTVPSFIKFHSLDNIAWQCICTSNIFKRLEKSFASSFAICITADD